MSVLPEIANLDQAEIPYSAVKLLKQAGEEIRRLRGCLSEYLDYYDKYGGNDILAEKSRAALND